MLYQTVVSSRNKQGHFLEFTGDIFERELSVKFHYKEDTHWYYIIPGFFVSKQYYGTLINIMVFIYIYLKFYIQIFIKNIIMFIINAVYSGYSGKQLI